MQSPSSFPDFAWGDHVDRENRDKRDEPVLCPFTIIVDTREQSPWSFLSLKDIGAAVDGTAVKEAYPSRRVQRLSVCGKPWSFSGIRADSKQKYRPLIVHTIPNGLKTGDYSILGMENEIAIERKSPGDAFTTFTHDRERFERELERMQSMRWGAVVIECGWEKLFAGPQSLGKSDAQSEVIGKTAYRSILAWSQRFPRVHWFPMPTRVHAERTAFRLLERYWNDRQEEKKRERAGTPKPGGLFECDL